MNENNFVKGSTHPSFWTWFTFPGDSVGFCLCRQLVSRHVCPLIFTSFILNEHTSFLHYKVNFFKYEVIKLYWCKWIFWGKAVIYTKDKSGSIIFLKNLNYVASMYSIFISKFTGPCLLKQLCTLVLLFSNSSFVECSSVLIDCYFPCDSFQLHEIPAKHSGWQWAFNIQKVQPWCQLRHSID